MPFSFVTKKEERKRKLKTYFSRKKGLEKETKQYKWRDLRDTLEERKVFYS